MWSAEALLPVVGVACALKFARGSKKAGFPLSVYIIEVFGINLMISP